MVGPSAARAADAAPLPGPMREAQAPDAGRLDNAARRVAAGDEKRRSGRRSRMSSTSRALRCASAAPALVLPFLIRLAVGGGIATATEVSTIAELYAIIIALCSSGC